jgi:hypothetical protein
MSELLWYVDVFTRFRGRLRISGWAFHSVQSIREMGMVLPGSSYVKLDGYGLPSIDVESHNGPAAHDCRFLVDVPVPPSADVANLKLVFSMTDGRTEEISHLSTLRLAADPYNQLWRRFHAMLREHNQGAMLQLGSPNPNLTPTGMTCVGLDLKEGKNVDVVGDPHRLSQLFEPQQFDAILSISLFEHMLMPWKVVLEMNRVLKPGGLVLISSHHTFPLHDEPNDLWRFSDRAWRGLFNEITGFKILDARMGEPAAVVPELLHSLTQDAEYGRAFLSSAVLCQKVGETRAQWDGEAQALNE